MLNKTKELLDLIRAGIVDLDNLREKYKTDKALLQAYPDLTLNTLQLALEEK